MFPATMLALLLETTPAPKVFEWRLQLGGEGTADAVFWFVPVSDAPKAKPLGAWRLVVEPAGPDGHSTARWLDRTAGVELTHDATLEIWEQDGEWWFVDSIESSTPAPLVTRTAPPRALSMELVPCRSPLMPTFDATCAALSQGPLGPAPVPLSAIRRSGRDDEVGRTAIAVFSIGTFVPGKHDDAVRVRLVAPRQQPPVSAELRRWTKSRMNEAAMPAALDAETAGAMLVLAGRPTPSLAVALARRVPGADDRWALLRLARQRGLSDSELVGVVAQLVDAKALGPAEDEALEASALTGLAPGLTRGVGALVRGRAPRLQVIALRAGRRDFDAEAMRAVSSGALSSAEIEVLALTMSKAQRDKQLATLLDPLEPDDGLALLDHVASVDGLAHWDLLPQVVKAQRWLDRTARQPSARRLVDRLSPLGPDGAVALFAPVVARSAAAEQAEVLVACLAALTFDAYRLALLDAERSVLAALSPADAARVLATFAFDDARAKARERLPAEVRAALPP